MKTVVLHSVKNKKQDKETNPYLYEANTNYAKRVIGNLRNKASFCTVCGPDCTLCRKPYDRSFNRDIAAVIPFPAVLPYVLEKPFEFVPKNIPEHDIILIIHIHEQILLEILKKCGEWGTKGVVVPLEAPHWLSGSAKKKAIDICNKSNIEIAFPKPFCSFNPPAGSLLDKFKNYFHIGMPDVDLIIEDNKIVKANVNVSAACGATYYIARWLEGKKLDDNIKIDVISHRMHSFPCTASMAWDSELDDTPLHIAGQAHYGILPDHKKIVEEKSKSVISPLGTVVQEAASPYENMRNIEDAKLYIIDALKESSPLTITDLKEKTTITPAALYSALLLLKKEGKLKSSDDFSFSLTE